MEMTSRLRDISIGGFRISQDYRKRLREREPDSAIVQYPFVNDHGVYRYPEEIGREMEEKLIEWLKEYVPESRIYALF